MMLSGYRVVESAAIPEFRARMQLSAKCADILRPEFAAEMNAWMLEFFGRERYVLMLPADQFGLPSIHGHPNTIAAIRIQTKGQQ